MRPPHAICRVGCGFFFAGQPGLLHTKSEREGAAGVKAKDWTDGELDRKSEAAKRCDTRPPSRWVETGWTPEQDALLGTDDDDGIGARIGRTAEAVRSRRSDLGVETFRDRRFRATNLPR
jgi:hypothetical protein